LLSDVDCMGSVNLCVAAVVLDVEPEVRLISYCLDPRVAIVMSLDYEIAEPESSSTHISTVVSAHGMPPRSLTAPASSGRGTLVSFVSFRFEKFSYHVCASTSHVIQVHLLLVKGLES
jgi:hypothetical protein